MIIPASYADLGDIMVKSYLGQKFEAVVPLTNLPKNTDYHNLNFGLASGAKFKEYGIDFNPELGSLLFKLNFPTPDTPLVVITSSKPINSPVFSFLLHYRMNKDDFYRQYMVLLDPVDYSGSSSHSQAKVIVARNVPRTYANSDNDKQKPIPVYSRPDIVSAAIKPSYLIDLSNPELQRYLKQFNQESMSYITSGNDNLYLIAKFNQLLYPKAQLTINQVLIALGMANYREMHAPEYLYESGVLITIPAATKINLISASLADEYLLDVGLNSEQRIGLLKAMAAKYNSAIIIESAELFVSKPQAKAIITPPVVTVVAKPVVEPAPLQPKPGILAIILDNILWILIAFIILLIIIAIRRQHPDFSFEHLKRIFARKKAKINKQDELKIDQHSAMYDTLNKFSHHRNLIRQQPGQSEEDTLVTTVESGRETVTDNLVDSRSLNFENEPSVTDESVMPDIKVALTPVSNIDHDLVTTLEKILLMDSSRNDIRYKLFELYLMLNSVNDASKTYYDLDRGLEIEDPLRTNIEVLCQRYAFIPVPEDQIINNLQGVSQPIAVEGSNYEYLASSEPEQIVNRELPEDKLAPEDNNHIVDFVSFTSSPATPEPDEVVSFSQERMLDFSMVDYRPMNNQDKPGEFIPAKNVESDFFEDILLDENRSLTEGISEIDEKINLAKMYFHIEEPEKAREIILGLLATDLISDSAQAEIDKLKAEMGIK